MAFYQVEVTDQVRKELRKLPGNIRQRIWRLLQSLRAQPRPQNSIALDLTNTAIKLAVNAELRRIQLDAWRVVYLIEEDIRLVSVLAIRRRPPYQYEDLAELVTNR